MNTAKDEYILARVQELQAAKGLTFEQGWNEVLGSSPDLLDGSVSAGFAKTKVGRDPRVATELAKHGQLEQSRKSAVAGDHAARLAAIRKLMAADPSLSFDQAFTAICQQETSAAMPVSTSTAVRKEATMLVAAGGSSDDLAKAIQAEHPEWDSEQVWAHAWSEYWT